MCDSALALLLLQNHATPFYFQRGLKVSLPFFSVTLESSKVIFSEGYIFQTKS